MAISPYIEQEAKRLKLVCAAPPAPKTGAARAGAQAGHDPRDWRFSRTQREAGIEHLKWEARIRPVRPLWFFVIAAGCWALFALAIAWTCAAL